METEHKSTENAMLALIEEIHQQTEKMCSVGPGHYGFGIRNRNSSELGMVITFEPSPVKDNVIFPEDVPGYEVSVQAFSKEEQRLLEVCEVEALLTEGTLATCKIAGAVIGLSKKIRHVTKEECLEAFDVLAERELVIREESEEPLRERQGPALC